jgi:hypothetical protein
MLLSISVSGLRSMMLPRLIGSDLLPSPGLERGGGVRDIGGRPDCGGCRFECDEVEDPGE